MIPLDTKKSNKRLEHTQAGQNRRITHAARAQKAATTREEIARLSLDVATSRMPRLSPRKPVANSGMFGRTKDRSEGCDSRPEGKFCDDTEIDISRANRAEQGVGEGRKLEQNSNQPEEETPRLVSASEVTRNRKILETDNEHKRVQVSRESHRPPPKEPILLSFNGRLSFIQTGVITCSYRNTARRLSQPRLKMIYRFPPSLPFLTVKIGESKKVSAISSMIKEEKGRSRTLLEDPPRADRQMRRRGPAIWSGRIQT
jgi:hypothetical protein